MQIALSPLALVQIAFANPDWNHTSEAPETRKFNGILPDSPFATAGTVTAKSKAEDGAEDWKRCWMRNGKPGNDTCSHDQRKLAFHFLQLCATFSNGPDRCGTISPLRALLRELRRCANERDTITIFSSDDSRRKG